MENKRIKLTKCRLPLHLVKAIRDVTKKSLLECKNIIGLMITPYFEETTGNYKYKYGILLLNESSITPEQWEKITQHPNFIKSETEFEYV